MGVSRQSPADPLIVVNHENIMGNAFTFERSNPLAHVMSRIQHFSDNAVAVFGTPQQFVGVLTRRSLLEPYWNMSANRTSAALIDTGQGRHQDLSTLSDFISLFVSVSDPRSRAYPTIDPFS